MPTTQARSFRAAPFLLVTSLLFTPGPPGLHAQVADSVAVDTAAALRPLEVQARRGMAVIGGTNAVELRLDSLALPAAPLLDEVLRQVPALHVRRNSRGEAEIVTRGSESRHVAVLVDGIPLSLTWDGRADVSVIPATAAQDLRFTRGPSSMLSGPNVLGGTVELTFARRQPESARSVQLTTDVEGHGAYGLAAVVTVPRHTTGGALQLRAGIARRETPGVPLARGIIEPLGASRGLRTNTDARSADIFAAARYWSNAGPWLAVTGTAMRGERGIAAELDVPRPRFWRYPHLARAFGAISGGTGDHATGAGRGALEFSVGYNGGRTDVVAYTDRSYAKQTASERGDDRTLTLRMLGSHTLGRRGDLRAALTLSDIRHDEFLAADAVRYEQRLWSAGGESTWLLLERHGSLRTLRLVLAGARDGARTAAPGYEPAGAAAEAWGARAGLSAVVGSSTQIHASASRRGRFPALREAYSGSLNRFAPNPDLGAEYLMAFEAGATASRGADYVQLVAFHHRLDDAIVRVTLPDGRFRRVNEDRVRTMGLELLGGWNAGPLSFSGDMRWQTAQLVTPVLRRGHLENQPALSGSLHVAAPIARGVRAAVQARYTGQQYCLATSGDDIRLDAGTWFRADVVRTWIVRAHGALLSRAEARAAIDNITDTALHDQCGLPREGRVLRLQLRLF